MSFHFIVRFEALAGKDAAFRDALLSVIGPSRAEDGCLAMQVFEPVHEPGIFAIHSEWVDEAAFERHSAMPHTLRFLNSARELLTEPVHGMRLREIEEQSGASIANS